MRAPNALLIFVALLLASATLRAQQPLAAPSATQNPDPNRAAMEARLKANPADLEAIILLAKSYLDAGEPQKALPFLKSAAELRPDAGPLVFQYGATQLETGDAEGAYRTLTALSQREPNEAATRAYLVRTTSRLNKPVETREHLTVLRRLVPGDPLFHAQLVEWIATEGDPTVATEQVAFTLGLPLDARRKGRLRLLEAFAHNRAGDSGSAIRSLRDAIALDGAQPNYYAMLFTLQGASGMRNVDVAMLKQAVQRFPASKDLLLITGLVNIDNQEFRAVREIAGRLDIVSPGSAEAMLLRGHLALANNEFAEGARLFNTALERGMRSAHVLHNLGLAQQKSGSSAEALDSYAKALELEPARTDLLFDYASLLLNTGDTAMAFTLAERYLPLAASEPRAHKLLADIERKRGNREAAAKHLAEFKRLSIEAQATRRPAGATSPAP
jgi:predicted Zn-dependent protease